MPPDQERDLAARIDALTIDGLRRRRTSKWAWYPADVLPAWVAETDFPVPRTVLAALRDMLDNDDLGYPTGRGFAEAFVGWAGRHQGWHPDPDLAVPVADVMAAVCLALAALTGPDEAIVLLTPSYPPFFEAVRAVHRPRADCPLRDTAEGWQLDFERIDAALAAGARAVLLCHPHNPTGRVWTVPELRELARLVDRHGAAVVSDEVHAPLLAAGTTFVPYAASSDLAAGHTVTATAVSKGWNLPGLRCALLQAQPATARVATGVPPLPRHGPNQAGILASIAAWTDDGGYLAEVCRYLDRTRDALAGWVAGHESVSWHRGQAGYLAWLDLRSSELGPDPAAVLLERGRVALHSGPKFGPVGEGHARLNHATSVSILAQVLARIDTVLTAARPD